MLFIAYPRRERQREAQPLGRLMSAPQKASAVSASRPLSAGDLFCLRKVLMMENQPPDLQAGLGHIAPNKQHHVTWCQP